MLPPELQRGLDVAFGAVHVPMRMDRVFDEETASLPAHADVRVTKASEVISSRDRLSRRIMARSGQSADDEAIEFGEPVPGF